MVLYLNTSINIHCALLYARLGWDFSDFMLCDFGEF